MIFLWESQHPHINCNCQTTIRTLVWLCPFHTTSSAPGLVGACKTDSRLETHRRLEKSQRNNCGYASHNTTWGMPNKALHHPVPARQPDYEIANTLEYGYLYRCGLVRGMWNVVNIDNITKGPISPTSWFEKEEIKWAMPFMGGFPLKCCWDFLFYRS